MYYVVELSTSISLSWIKKLHPLCATWREESWVFTNKRAAKLKYREVCRSHIHCGKYHDYGMRHGGLIMRVHKHDKYTSEIVVTLQKIAYTPKKLHDVTIIDSGLY